jgi:hypothetical protein
MNARTLVLAAVAGLCILAGTAASVLLLKGSGPAAVRGVVLGGGLGAVGVALEASLLVRALALPRGQALGIVTAGFVVRLAVLACGTLLLKGGGFADPSAFALSFVGGFFAGIPIVAASASGFRKASAGAGP